MGNNKLNYNLVNILLWMVLVYIGILTFSYWGGIIRKLWGVLLPFLLAFIIAYVLYPFVKRLEKLGVKKGLALFLVLFFVVVLLGGVLWSTIPVIYEQLVLFTKIIGDVIHQVSGRFDVDLGSFETTLFNFFNQLLQSLGTWISSGTLDILNKSIRFLTDSMIVLVVSIYFLIDMDKIREGFKNFLKSISSKWFYYVRELDLEIGNYFYGLALLMIIQFFEYAFIFLLVGHPNWLLLGILASVTTVIPYFGGIITNIIAMITASVISVPLFISTLVIILVFPNIDGYLISPRVYEKTNHVNPILAILSIGIFSSFFGLFGIMMALPGYIVIRCTWNYFLKEKMKILSFGKYQR